MPVIQRSLAVPFTSAQMFDLVNNIEHYPQFLPWCANSTVHTRSNSQIKATLHIAKGLIKKSFTTVNQLTPHEGIEMRLIDGPFRHLAGSWQFQQQAEGCIVSLKLAFEFSNPLLAMTFGPIFQHIASTFVQSFSARAYQVYVTA